MVIATTTATFKNYIKIPKEEYSKLKKLQKYFEKFVEYFEHLQDIKKAREDVKLGRTISQKKLFKELKI